MLTSKVKQFSTVSRLGLGTVQFGMDYGLTKKKTQEEVDEILDECRESKINFIDTAYSYGDSEEKIGNYIKSHPKSEFIIATKLPLISKALLENKKKLSEYIYRAIDDSCDRLHIDSIQVLQLHQEDRWLIECSALWDIVEQLKKEDRIKLFGVSLYEVEMAHTLIENYVDHVDLVQVPLNILNKKFVECLPLFSDNNISVVSRSVFLKGVLTASEEEVPSEVAYLKPVIRNIKKLALQWGYSVPDFLLLYVLSLPLVASTVIGVGSVYQLRSNVRLLKKLDHFKSLGIDFSTFFESEKVDVDPRKWATV